MLKKKLYIAGVIIVCMALVAAASGKIAQLKRDFYNTPIADKALSHQFDSNGLCTCIPFSSDDEINDAPKVQLVSSVASFVKKYNQHNGLYLDKAKKKTEKYFNVVDSILRLNDVPAELKYLAFIESGMSKNPVTRTGAIGPWALMPKAAKQYGLKTGANDERLNFSKSTAAAAKLMKDMYADYGDWLLVVAAYNCGPGGMERAMKKSGSRDYWQLQNFLPAETRSHIKKFIAVHYHFEGHGSLVTMTKKETEAHIQAVAAFTEQQQKKAIDTACVFINY